MRIKALYTDLIRAKSTKETHDHLSKLLDRSPKLYYSRFGDGDVYILMGKSQANHSFCKALQDELMESVSIEDPLFLKGMQVNFPEERGMTKGLFQLYKYNNDHARFLLNTLPSKPPVIFESSWFPNYYTSFRPRQLNTFLDTYIRPKRKMFIGSVPKEDAETIFGHIDLYIATPRKNAYAEMDSWWPQVLDQVDQVELVLPAVGMATRVINKRLWKLGKEIHCLDLGSIVDAASCYPSSRHWIKLKRHMINQILLPEYRDNKPSYWLNCAWREGMLGIRKTFYDIDPFARIPFIRKARRYHPGPPKHFN